MDQINSGCKMSHGATFQLLLKNTFYLKIYIFGLTLFIDAFQSKTKRKKTIHLLQPIKPKIMIDTIMNACTKTHKYNNNG